MRDKPLAAGEPAPWFTARCTSHPSFQFDAAGGRQVVLCFFGSAADPAARRVLDDLLREPARFDDSRLCFFGVSTDPDDERQGRVSERLPGVRFFWDFDRAVSRLYGAEHPGGYRPHTVLLDRRLRAVAAVPLEPPETHLPRLLEALAGLPAAPADEPAPVLVVPRVFEPELCRALVRYYDDHGGEDSGFMVQRDGRTVPTIDHAFKRRRDQEVRDEGLCAAARGRVNDRLVPEVLRAFQFRATRIERYLVACYDAAAGGFFRSHRDNRTRGTAHRCFAVSLNLNTGAYDGGRLRFPEFGRHAYEAPAGGAVVFSCSLLHEATPVTRGRRYAFLPFLYDEAAARLRQQNLQSLAGGGAAPGGG